ncbi:Rha family transcriptional regulator [Paenibacillus oenotherae]|uniref:Rha family transcriptional regulator n=1 Tax=Paenibacillus oenotherae TaxID=1435645 RepID=A0ABS7D7Q8_9BACL|nr:Rha family transcriptional regulator [Paenibacillus oenotherae]MBW7475915.1 Rha family transcriptional regulator [Paenibacillus oenotherae]
MNLVRIENGRPVTDSLTVAETFGKEHRRVMQDVRELECSEEFNQHNFVQIDYTDSRNRTYPKYLITEQGFAFLVMGYTGKEAARFKEMYISEFGRMREQLQRPVALDSQAAISIALRQTADMMDKLPQIETRLEEIDNKVETQITLTQGEQRRVQRAVSSRVYEFPADTEERSKLFRELYRDIKDRWGVPSYRDVLRKDLQSVIKYVDAWHPRKEV